MDRHHDPTTREYNRRLVRLERTTREHITDHHTIRTDRRISFTTRFDPWYQTILAKLVSKNKKEKCRNYECLQISCDLSLANCFTYISVLKQILAPVGNISVSAR